MPSESIVEGSQTQTSSTDAGVSQSAQPAAGQDAGSGYSEDAVRRQANEAFTKATGRTVESPSDTTPASGGEKPGGRTEPEPQKKDESPKISEKKLTIRGDEGKDEEVTISIDQAKRAILRDKFPASVIAKWTDQEILDYGANRFLAQREADRFSTRAAEWRRLAENGSRTQSPQASPQSAQNASNQAGAKTPEAADAGRDGKQTPTDAAHNGQVSEPNPKWREKLAAIREVAGDDMAKVLEDVVSSVQDDIRSDYQKRFDDYHTQNSQTFAQMGAMTRDILLEAARKDLAADFPELKTEKAWESVRENALVIGASGRFEKPIQQIGDIVREAALAHLGVKGQIENRARQLAGRRKVETDGQPDPGPADNASRRSPGALPPEEVSKKILAELREGANPADLARKYAQR